MNIPRDMTVYGGQQGTGTTIGELLDQGRFTADDIEVAKMHLEEGHDEFDTTRYLRNDCGFSLAMATAIVRAARRVLTEEEASKGPDEDLIADVVSRLRALQTPSDLPVMKYLLFEKRFKIDEGKKIIAEARKRMAQTTEQ